MGGATQAGRAEGETQACVHGFVGRRRTLGMARRCGRTWDSVGVGRRGSSGNQMCAEKKGWTQWGTPVFSLLRSRGRDSVTSRPSWATQQEFVSKHKTNPNSTPQNTEQTTKTRAGSVAEHCRGLGSRKGVCWGAGVRSNREDEVMVPGE